MVISNEAYHNSCADTVIVPLTSNIDAPLSIGDYQILNWQDAGLWVPSVAKGKPTTIALSTVREKLGALGSDDLEGVLSGVKAILG